MDTPICQSCGMPMQKSEDFGTNADMSINTDYCCYCYKNGTFDEEMTMNEMIERCLQFLDEFNKDIEQPLTVEEARKQMQQFFPILKRWKQ